MAARERGDAGAGLAGPARPHGSFARTSRARASKASSPRRASISCRRMRPRNASEEPSPRTSMPALTLDRSRSGPTSSSRAATCWTGSKRRSLASTGPRRGWAASSRPRWRIAASATSRSSKRSRVTRGPERTVSRQGTASASMAPAGAASSAARLERNPGPAHPCRSVAGARSSVRGRRSSRAIGRSSRRCARWRTGRGTFRPASQAPRR